MFRASASQPAASLHSQSSRAVGSCFRRSMKLRVDCIPRGGVEHHQALHLSLPSDFFKDLFITLSSMTLS